MGASEAKRFVMAGVCAGRIAKIVVLLAGCASLSLAQGTAGPPISTTPPTVELGSSGIEARGLTPGGATVIFGIARRSEPHWQALERHAQIVPADATGAASWTAEKAIPWKSVWFVVDVASGQFTTSVPEGFVSDEIAFPGKGIGEALNVLHTDGESMEFLWVRPGHGAWTLESLDGGRSDGDQSANRRLQIDFTKFESLGSSPSAPERLAPGDIVVGVDYRSLTFYAARLAG